MKPPCHMHLAKYSLDGSYQRHLMAITAKALGEDAEGAVFSPIFCACAAEKIGGSAYAAP